MGMTWDLINLIGLENMMVGMIEEPEAIHAIMDYLCEDHLRLAKFLEDEGIFCPNTDNDYIGSGSRGYTSNLPKPAKDRMEGHILRIAGYCWNPRSPYPFRRICLPSLFYLTKKR
jgi:hypothetical protein